MRIVEILDRSEQGVTRPFLCRGEDGELYYVKGRFAGYHALCCEWVAGELARRWDLPVAPFAIVEVPAALVRGNLRDDAFDLGDGPAFGSRLVPHASELRWNEVESEAVPEDLRAHVLIFDWWVANPDRILSQTAGNPNLLWSAREQQLSVIDHNLAFSSHKMPPSLLEFCEDHVFGRSLIIPRGALWSDEPAAPLPSLRQASGELREFWKENRTALDEIWEELPEEWTDAAPDFTLEEVRAFLNRVEGDDFEGVEASDENSNKDA